MSDNSPRELFNRCPPFLVVALAKLENGPRRGQISVRDISRATGIPMRTLTRILQLDTWDNVRVRVAHKILASCHISVTNMWRSRRYMKSTVCALTPFSHLTRQQRSSLLSKMARFNERQN